MLGRFRRGKMRQAVSPIVATAATLRRNVGNEKFFVAMETSHRNALVSRLAGSVKEAFDAIGAESLTFDGVSAHADAMAVYMSQGWGLLPAFRRPPEEKIAYVLDDRSPKLALKTVPAAMAATVGVEDHIQIGAITPALDPEALWTRLDRIDTELGRRVEYAFRRDVGYLTANPALAGSALTFSAYMMPLGLELVNEADETIRDMKRRGCVFEQADAIPPVFSGLCKVSFECGGGRSELQAAQAFRRAMEELAERESDARREMAEDGETYLLDAFSRDLAILKNAYAIAENEAISELWTVRTGIDMGYVDGVAMDDIEAAIESMPSPVFAAAIAKDDQETMESMEALFGEDDEVRDDIEDHLDTVRAEYMRTLLRKARIVD